jgi:hypothetical protein
MIGVSVISGIISYDPRWPWPYQIAISGLAMLAVLGLFGLVLILLGTVLWILAGHSAYFVTSTMAGIERKGKPISFAVMLKDVTSYGRVNFGFRIVSRTSKMLFPLLSSGEIDALERILDQHVSATIRGSSAVGGDADREP